MAGKELRGIYPIDSLV